MMIVTGPFLDDQSWDTARLETSSYWFEALALRLNQFPICWILRIGFKRRLRLGLGFGFRSPSSPRFIPLPFLAPSHPLPTSLIRDSVPSSSVTPPPSQPTAAPLASLRLVAIWTLETRGIVHKYFGALIFPWRSMDVRVSMQCHYG